MNEIFDSRCALVNKNGVCHQCRELNGLFNPKQKKQENLLKKNSEKNNKNLYQLRTDLIKGINPLTSPGSDLENVIMQVLYEAISET